MLRSLLRSTNKIGSGTLDTIISIFKAKSLNFIPVVWLLERIVLFSCVCMCVCMHVWGVCKWMVGAYLVLFRDLDFSLGSPLSILWGLYAKPKIKPESAGYKVSALSTVLSLFSC